MKRSSPPSSSESDIRAFRAFVRASGLLRNVMEPYFAQFGLSGAQWGVLRSLHRAQGAGESRLRLTDLGKRLLVRPPSVSGVVDRLRRAGLVARSRASSDRRAKEVVLTPRGRRLVERVLRRHPRQIRLVLGGLNQAEVRELRRLMDQISIHLEELDHSRHSSEEGDS